MAPFWLRMRHFLLLVCLLPFEVTQCLVASQWGVANPVFCSFTDDATGFYASWHSNCSKIEPLVRKCLNTTSLHCKTKKSPRQKSTEVALVENLSGAFVSVSPARIEAGTPPIREMGGGILINPRGSFFGSILEATFAIDETLLSGCKEFLFYTALTPVGAPYGGIPYSKTVCDVARTCARYQCGAEFGAFPMPNQMYGGNPMLGRQIGAGLPSGGKIPPMAPMDFFDKDIISQMPAQMATAMLASAMPGQQGMEYQFGTALPQQQQFGMFHQQMDPTALMGQQFGHNGKLIHPQRKEAKEEADDVQNSTVTIETPESMANATDSVPLLTSIDDAASSNGTIPSNSTQEARQKRQSQLGFTSLQGTAYEGQDRLFQREPPVPAVNTRYEALDEWRARQGQYQPPARDQTVGTGMYWPYRTIVGPGGGTIVGGDVTGRAQREEITLSAGQPAINSRAIGNFYDPARCDNGVDPQWCSDYVRQFVEWFGRNGAGRARPSMGGQAGATACPALRDALLNSDHHCCNALQRMGC